MSQYFPIPFKNFGRNINVKVDLYNYTTKANEKNISRVALKSNLASLKTNINKFNIDKLVPVLADLSKLRDIVQSDVVKKLRMIN